MHISLLTSFKSVFLLFAIIVSLYALGYDWIRAHATDGIPLKFKSLNFALVYSHLVGAAFALSLGGVQLFTRKGSRWHRHLGISYCLAVIVGGIGGGYLSFFAEQGPSTGLGFFILDILWFYTTYMAWRSARAHQVVRHRRWIIRSLALAAAAISLRLELLLFTQFWSFETSYLIVAWSCWLGNLIFVEIYLYLNARTVPHLQGNLSNE